MFKLLLDLSFKTISFEFHDFSFCVGKPRVQGYLKSFSKTSMQKQNLFQKYLPANIY